MIEFKKTILLDFHICFSEAQAKGSIRKTLSPWLKARNDLATTGKPHLSGSEKVFVAAGATVIH
ncbi:hypothetical protein [Methylomicrobium lacus]|uniref:hypothetical protein n=1 Tax=Methylomicrobium lacus TaxID=136992 RepID=UPI0004AE8188|nr:hypothetical protein [Methylomicrobium lacus]